MQAVDGVGEIGSALADLVFKFLICPFQHGACFFASLGEAAALLGVEGAEQQATQRGNGERGVRGGLFGHRAKVGEDHDPPGRAGQVAGQCQIRAGAGQRIHVAAQVLGQADDGAFLGAVEGDVEADLADGLTGELLVAHPFQPGAGLRLQGGIAPFRGRGEEDQIIAVHDQGGRFLRQPAPFKFADAGFDDGKTDDAPFLGFVADGLGEVIAGFVAHVIHRVMTGRNAGGGIAEERHVGEVGAEQIVGKDPVAGGNDAAAGVEHENRRATEMVVELLQETVGRGLQDVLFVFGRTEQGEDVGIEFDSARDGGVARDLAVDGRGENVELMAGSQPHVGDADVFRGAVGDQAGYQKNRQQQGQPKRTVWLGKGRGNRRAGFGHKWAGRTPHCKVGAVAVYAFRLESTSLATGCFRNTGARRIVRAGAPAGQQRAIKDRALAARGLPERAGRQ